MFSQKSEFWPSRVEIEYLEKGYFNDALAEYAFRIGIPKEGAKPILLKFFVAFYTRKRS